ncbi:response regulator transcription factor [Dongia sp.]|uniref:response regulator transcription factor n=1 Tax=Dongia sp. TaxID=1977262 RepID=UPI0035AFCA06
MTLVYIVDDDDAVRDSLSILLESAGLTIEAFPSADPALARARKKTPDCIVTDIRMPGMDGMELFAALTKAGVDAPVIIMTGHGEVPLAVAAMKAGVADFVEKPFNDDAIIGAISSAIRKHQDRLRLRPASAELQARLDSLTSREREVFDLLVAGDANKIIAHALDISIRTVEIHRARVMEKMKAKSLPELVRMALELGTLRIS